MSNWTELNSTVGNRSAILFTSSPVFPYKLFSFADSCRVRQLYGRRRVPADDDAAGGAHGAHRARVPRRPAARAGGHRRASLGRPTRRRAPPLLVRALSYTCIPSLSYCVVAFHCDVTLLYRVSGCSDYYASTEAEAFALARSTVAAVHSSAQLALGSNAQSIKVDPESVEPPFYPPEELNGLLPNVEPQDPDCIYKVCSFTLHIHGHYNLHCIVQYMYSTRINVFSYI